MTAKRERGRPREIEAPYRLNLYVDSGLVSDLARLARELTQKEQTPVSIGQALAKAARTSPLIRRLDPLPRDPRRRPSTARLAKAIAEGATLRPQGQPRAYFQRDPGTKELLGSTALGAAWEAVGQDARLLTTAGLYQAFPVLMAERPPDCPAGGTCRTGRTLDAHIIHLEDRHGWDRERVARWVKTLEL